MAGKKRRHKSGKAQIEDEILSKGRWSGLKEQQRLLTQNHTAEQNQRDREDCRRLVNEGFSSDVEFVRWLDLLGQK